MLVERMAGCRGMRTLAEALTDPDEDRRQMANFALNASKLHMQFDRKHPVVAAF